MTESSVVSRLFDLNLKVMRLFGCYPSRINCFYYRFYSTFVYITCTTGIPVLATLQVIQDPEIDFEKFADSTFIICQLGCFILKMLPFHLNHKQIRDTIYMIERPVFTTYTKKQQRFMRDCEKTCNHICRLFLVACFANIVLWALMPYFENVYRLPMGMWFPYNWKSNHFSFIASYVYTVVGAGHGAISNGAIDPLIAGLAYYVTTQIRILKDNLNNLDHKYSKSVKYQKIEPVYKNVCEELKKCIVHHKEIIELVARYEDSYSFVVFCQFSVSVFVICINCFKLSLMKNYDLTFVFMVLFLVTMLAEIFLYCYFGTLLFEESNTLTQGVYMGRWYEYDLKSQKTLLTLMECSKKPIVVTAGKILDLSLGTFMTILRRAYSLLAVLKNY